MPRRARKEEQKEERRQAMLDSAWLLFQGQTYAEVTMAQVADSLELTKGAVYLYFKTKEELFLAVLEQQLGAWFREVNAGLAALGRDATSAEVATVLSEALARRPALARLLALLHPILEQNIDFETALRFKQFLLKNLSVTGGRLETCLPYLLPGQGGVLLLQIDALIVGLHYLSSPAPVVQAVLREPSMGVFNIDFAQTFSRTLQALLDGLAVKTR